jgi:heptosyltransferase-2
MAEVDAVIANPFRHGEFSFGARRALGRRLLASADYSTPTSCPTPGSRRWSPFFAGIPRRIGYQGESALPAAQRRHRLDTRAIRNWCSATPRWPAPCPTACRNRG